MDSKRMVGGDAPDQETQIERLAPLGDKLEKEMKRLEELFWVSPEKLKSISTRFGEELAEGLEAEGKNISMNMTWVLGFPTGKEKGSFLTIDLGGTNIRICWITLTGEGSEVDQDKYKLSDELKKGSAEDLWSFIAESLQQFIKSRNLKGDEANPLPLGFTFSYPVLQDYIDHGVLQTWTKGFDIKGCEGHDAGAQLRQAMEKRKLPVKLICLINDTVGAMIASAYNDPHTIIGAIFGTGCNAAYMEDCGTIPKLTSKLPKDLPMAINCEYGAFDNSHQSLPRTPYDETIDKESPRPGEQTFEKMSAGLYLGEIARLVLVDLHQKSLIFEDQTISKLQDSYIIDTAFLSAIEDDESPKLRDTAKELQAILNITPTEPELELLRRLAELIAVRGARLCACGIAAICKKKGITKGHVAADGSVANKHPKFKKRWAQALGEILDWETKSESDQPILLTSAEDGSGVGAAVIAAMTMERARKGQTAGIRRDAKI